MEYDVHATHKHIHACIYAPHMHMPTNPPSPHTRCKYIRDNVCVHMHTPTGFICGEPYQMLPGIPHPPQR